MAQASMSLAQRERLIGFYRLVRQGFISTSTYRMVVFPMFSDDQKTGHSKFQARICVKAGGARFGRFAFQLFYFLGCQAEALLKNARTYYGHQNLIVGNSRGFVHSVQAV